MTNFRFDIKDIKGKVAYAEQLLEVQSGIMALP